MSEFREIRRDWARAIAARRRACGYTQRVVAQLVDVDQALLSRWEHGHAIPNDEAKLRLAGALGCRVSDLFPWPAEVPPVPRAKPVRKVAA